MSRPGNRLARRFGIGVTWIVIALTAACSIIDPDPATPRPVINPSLAIHPGGDTHTALVIGVLIAEDGCLFLGGDGESRMGIGWPPGTRWDAVNQAVVVGRATARPGDSVGLGGSQHDLTVETIDDRPWLDPPKPECLGDRFWIAGGLSTVR